MIKIWKKNAKDEIEVHYQFLETKILATRHKQHAKFQFKFRPKDGYQMVNTSLLILYSNLNID
jgi:hypothetical protein